MRGPVSKLLCRALFEPTASAAANANLGVSKRTLTALVAPLISSTNPSGSSSPSLLVRGGGGGGLLSSPWLLSQQRGAKVLGSEVRPGNIVQRKGRLYQVLKAQHTQHGRGGASIQVELRDVDSGNKVAERFRTDEAIERVYVEEKTLKYLYAEGDTVVLTDPESFEQVEVSKELFGKAAVYLQDDMTVTLQYYDERPMSASVPHRVSCIVVEAQTPMKGLSVNPQYKKVLLDNGLTVLVGSPRNPEGGRLRTSTPPPPCPCFAGTLEALGLLLLKQWKLQHQF